MSNLNTVEKALKIITNRFGADSDELKRVQTLISTCESWAEDMEFTGRQTELLLISACLLNIGKDKELNRLNFYPVDGYIYLKSNRWDNEVCDLVLHQSNAVNMPKPNNINIESYYFNPLPDELEVMHKILTLVNFTTNDSGEKVTIDERVNELDDKLGDDYPMALHVTQLSYEVAAWALDLRFRK